MRKTDAFDSSIHPVFTSQGHKATGYYAASSFRKTMMGLADEYELLQADFIALRSESQHLLRSHMVHSDIDASALLRAFPAQAFQTHAEISAGSLSSSIFKGPSRAQDEKLTEISARFVEEVPAGRPDPLQGIHLGMIEPNIAFDDVPQERRVNDFVLPRCEGVRASVRWCGDDSHQVVHSLGHANGSPRESICSKQDIQAKLSLASRESCDRMSQLFPTWFDPAAAIKTSTDPDEQVPQSIASLGGYTEQSEVKGQCVLGPVSSFRLTWDMLATICLFCELWTTPFELIFTPKINILFLQALSYGITVFFTADIILNFSTGYIQGTKAVVMDRARITKHYLKGWFIVDLIATIPIDLIMAGVDGDVFAAARLSKSSKMLKTLRYLKLIRAVRMLRTINRARNYQRSFDTHWLLRKMFWPMVVSLLLALISHFNGCLFAALWPEWAVSDTVADGLLKYYDSFTLAYVKLIGVATELDRSSLPGLWTFDCLVASERLVLLAVLAKRLSLFILALEEQARDQVVREHTQQYLRRRNVSFGTQLEVLFSIQETAKAQNMQKHFKELCSNDMPTQLRRTISQELWSAKLMSLGLIMHINNWHHDFVMELALLVREEIFPSHACMFREGEAAIAAYYIIEGELAVQGSGSPAGTIPDFTVGMWLGEKALVNPLLRRAASVTTKALTMVMAISATSFQDLLMYLGLMPKFQTFCSEQLWRGLCGRCGVLGDHFADECPKLYGRTDVGPRITEAVLQDGGRQSTRPSATWQTCAQTPGAEMGTTMTKMGSMQSLGNIVKSSSATFAAKKAKVQEDVLRRFLRRQQKESLLSKLKQIQIESLEDLEDADLEELNVELELPLDELQALSKESITKFREQTAQAVHKALFSASSAKNEYLVFLSHHKEGAGTEAALLRTELLRAISQDPRNPAHSFDVPVFLDSEDLQNLSDVQERVVMSHNLVVLLTKDVLTRPWVLVELVTARRNGLRILPIKVCKPANEFEMPDEEFHKALLDGRTLSAASLTMLGDCDIELSEVVKAIRHMFNRIMIPYSPHRSEAVRQAEVGDILKQCGLKPGPRRRGSQTSMSSSRNVLSGTSSTDTRSSYTLSRGISDPEI